MRKKILITGGAGYIGSLVNKMLFDSGYDTFVLDDLSCGKQEMVVRGTFIKGDFADIRLLDTIFRMGIDAVIHFAGLTSVGDSVKDPLTYYDTNTSKTLVLLQQMAKHGVHHLIFSSTAAVYGIPAVTPIKETAPLQPINPYGHSKLMAETMMRDRATSSELTCIALRYFNAAGGDPDGEISTSNCQKSNIIPILSHCASNPETPFYINGDDYETPDGTCIRDYIHLYDLSTAHILALQKVLDGCESAVYNLGNGNGFSVREVVDTFCAVTGESIRPIVGPRRKGDPAILVADATLAQKELQWKPRFPQLETIIRDAWKCYSPGAAQGV